MIRTALLLLLACPAPAAAQALSDAESARQAVRRGEILPLAGVVAELQRQYPGTILDVEFDEEDGVLTYEIELLTQTGRLLEIEMDARTAEILEVEQE